MNAITQSKIMEFLYALKSAINTVRTIINDYIYRCDIGGYEHQFKFDNIFKEHLFVNGVYKGCQKVVQLVEDKD